MPTIELSDRELEALFCAYTINARVDWKAYDRAKIQLIVAGQQAAARRVRARIGETPK